MKMKTFKEKLLIVQIAFGAITKKRRNEFHGNQYFDINDLLEQLEPILHEQRILLTQPMFDNRVYSKLECLDSGETIESYLEIPEGVTNAQQIGSFCTYFRRYSLSGLIALRSEKDDDGNTAAQVDKPEVKKTWLTPKQFEATKKGTAKQIEAVLKKYDGKEYCMKKTYKDELVQILDNQTIETPENELFINH